MAINNSVDNFSNADNTAIRTNLDVPSNADLTNGLNGKLDKSGGTMTGTLIVPAVNTDTITEKTSNAGVTIEGITLKDNNIDTPGAIGYNLSIYGINFTTGAATLGATSLSTLQVTSGLTLPTSGGTPTSLTYYEEYTSFGNTWSGIWGAAQALEYKLTRIGNIVFFDSLDNVLATATSGATISNTQAIPTRFRPSLGYNLIDGVISNNSAVVVGRIDVNTSGIITIQLSPSGNFTGSGTGGFYHFRCQWMV